MNLDRHNRFIKNSEGSVWHIQPYPTLSEGSPRQLVLCERIVTRPYVATGVSAAIADDLVCAECALEY